MDLGTRTIGAFVVLWGIAVVLVSIFACQPVSGVWDLSIPSKCINFNRFFIGISIPNVLADVMVLCLPMPQLWKLKLPPRTKVIVSGIFLTGGL